MLQRKIYILTMILVAASCAPAAPTDCDSIQIAETVLCTSVSEGLILADNKINLEAGKIELDAAHTAYLRIMGSRAPRGLLMIGNVPDPEIKRRDLKWKLQYSPNRHFELVKADNDFGPETLTLRARPKTKSTTSLSDAVGQTITLSSNAAYDQKTLRHEICHAYVREYFSDQYGQDESVPAFTNELFALSCEDETTKAERLIEFSQLRLDHSPMNFHDLLTMGHPLSGSQILDAVLGEMAKSGSSSATFSLEADTSEGQNTHLYYSQISAFSSYLDQMPNGIEFVGTLIKYHSQHLEKDEWIEEFGNVHNLPSAWHAVEEDFIVWVESTQ